MQIDARQIEHQSLHRRAPTMNIAVYHFTIGVPVEDGRLTNSAGLRVGNGDVPIAVEI